MTSPNSGRRHLRMHLARSMTRLLFAVAIAMTLRLPASAQTVAESWSTPVNLSQSGAASTPIAIPAPDGGMRVFWWDRVAGVTLAERVAGEWSPPVATPIEVIEELQQPAADGSRLSFDPHGGHAIHRRRRGWNRPRALDR